MSLTIVALILFLAMVAAWAVLPGSAVAQQSRESNDSLSPNAVGQTA
jgi:hypothetical protein